MTPVLHDLQTLANGASLLIIYTGGAYALAVLLSCAVQVAGVFHNV